MSTRVRKAVATAGLWILLAGLHGGILMRSPSWTIRKTFDDVMAISNAIHVVGTGRWDETFFRSRIRPLITLSLLPAALFEPNTFRTDIRSPSDDNARLWHIYAEDKEGEAIFRTSSLWALAFAALSAAYFTFTLRAQLGSWWLALPSATAATWLMSRLLSQPVTQMLSWAFSLLLVSAFAAVIRRTQPSGWQVGLLSAFALLGTQEIGPALAAVGITWTLVAFRRDGARAVAVQAAIAGICGLTVIALYYYVVLRSSPMELVDFFRIDQPFTQALMHYQPNTWAGSWRTASRVAGPLWVVSLASAAYLGATAMIPRRAENPWPIFWTLFFVGAFLFPASQEFIFARFFAGLTVSAPVVTALAIRQAAQAFWQSPRAET